MNIKTGIGFLVVLLTSFSVLAEREKFFANPELQGKAAIAFALHDNNVAWLQQAHAKRAKDAQILVNALKSNKPLFNRIKDWENLTFEQRMALLPEVFEVECEVLGITPPTLVINETLYPKRAVNFVYDINSPGSGLVYLNPARLRSMEVWDPLAFLLHETRHAYQFQMGFNEDSLMARGFKAAFEAQMSLSGFSFSDFLTLLNEYEAFQFGNHVVGLLSDWKADMSNMGTYASQFVEPGVLKINLVEVADGNAPETLLEKYNLLAEEQYQVRLTSREE